MSVTACSDACELFAAGPLPKRDDLGELGLKAVRVFSGQTTLCRKRCGDNQCTEQPDSGTPAHESIVARFCGIRSGQARSTALSPRVRRGRRRAAERE